MSSLSEFLLSRIAEDERRLDLPDYDVVLNSHGAVSARGDGWVTRGDCPVCGKYMFDGTEAVTEEAWWEHAEEAHQRTRLLAECEAKRRIVEEHPLVQSQTQADVIGCDTCGWDDFSWGPEMVTNGPCVTLRALAIPYADHPDYDEDWRP